MYILTKFRSVIFILVLLIQNSLLLTAEPNYLAYGNIKFPIVINFPNKPESSSMDNLLIPGSTLYYYMALDTNKSLVYNVTITTIPENLGWISRDIAQMMVDNTLDNQIKLADSELNAISKIVEVNTIPLKGYPSKFIIATRLTEPILRTYYRSVMVGQLLIIIWVNGIDSSENRLLAVKFITSLDIRQ